MKYIVYTVGTKGLRRGTFISNISGGVVEAFGFGQH